MPTDYYFWERESDCKEAFGGIKRSRERQVHVASCDSVSNFRSQPGVTRSAAHATFTAARTRIRNSSGRYRIVAFNNCRAAILDFRNTCRPA